jgi:hypothetical protein
MKLVTKIAAASILALSAVAPALAAEENTLLERNSYLSTENRPVTHQAQPNRLSAHRAVDALAFAPANDTASWINLGIGSQS